MLWLPILLASAVVYTVYSQRRTEDKQPLIAPLPPLALSCPGLPAAQRADLERNLAMDEATILRNARAAGIDRPTLLASLAAGAASLDVAGCPADAARVRLKASAVAAAPEPPLTAPVEPPSAPQPGAPAPGMGPGTGALRAPRRPLALLQCALDKCWVRPEPRAWNDAWGRFGFTIPSGYRASLVAMGPPGWGQVELVHPDHGLVDGWIELAQFVPAGSLATAAAPAAVPVSKGAQFPGRPGMPQRSMAKPSKQVRPTSRQI